MSSRRVTDTYSVFVGQLGSDVSKEDLNELFKGCGTIAESVILEDKTGIKANYGFVRYWDGQSALRAISDLNGWKLKGQTILVDISKQTSMKIRKEQQATCLKQIAGGKTQRVNNAVNGIMKDAMYLNRLKDSVTSLNLQHAQDQRSYNRLLNDLGPLSSYCSTKWSSLKETASFEKVSAKIMEKCKDSEETMLFGKQKVEEFKRSLQVIVSEISHDIDLVKVACPAKPAVIQQSLVEGGEMFDRNLVPKSVRILQKLDKYKVKNYSEAGLPDQSVECEGLKCTPTIVDDSFMTETDMVEEEVDVISGYSDGQSNTELVDSGVLDYHVSKQIICQDKSYQSNEIDHNFGDDILENLYLKMKVSRRSNSRDSSFSEESVEGNTVDDSGVECGDVGMMDKPAQPKMYEFYRAEGRQRPGDRPDKHGQLRFQTVTDQQPDKLSKEFSLESYILKKPGITWLEMIETVERNGDCRQLKVL